ncbi:MAG: FAD-binding oxidoreductase [Lentisphaerae bacterium]|nr:FAD-binding oxidoreductase [Lentisphaerota bacterium]
MTHPSQTAEAAFHHNVAADYPDCLRDESRMAGRADSVSFPTDEAELADHLAAAHAAGMQVTVQGARTGIAGGSVPNGGHVINLAGMNRVMGVRPNPHGKSWLLTVEPGVALSVLRDGVRRREFDTAGWPADSIRHLDAFRAEQEHFFAPDPTETSASAGGMAACNASGAQSLLYGPTRAHIHAARVVLARGHVLDLARGRERCRGRAFNVVSTCGSHYAGAAPQYRMPAVKNAAGYYASDDMDLLDIFIGSDGTLGVFSMLTLNLLPAPRVRWGVTAFLGDDSRLCDLVTRLRGVSPRPAAIEYFDGRALDLLRRRISAGSVSDIPAPPAGAAAALYTEFHGATEAEAEAGALAFAGLLPDHGGSEDATWFAEDIAEMEKLKAFRHAVPESVNSEIDARRKSDPGITKLGTDLAVPDAYLGEMLALYRNDLGKTGLDHVSFGHIGNNHVHVNILPGSMDDYRRGKELYLRWARKAVSVGGTVSAEHGIGKLKKDMLHIMYGDSGIAEMRRVRRIFDPDHTLNHGNLFD